MQPALAPGLQVVGDGDDAGVGDEKTCLLGHLPDRRRLEALAKLQMATGDGPVGGVAALALAEQHLALVVDEDDTDPDARIGSGHKKSSLPKLDGTIKNGPTLGRMGPFRKSPIGYQFELTST